AGVELLAADAEVLLRLRHPGLGRRGGGQALLGGPLRRAHRRLELVELAPDGDAVLRGLVASGGDLGLAARVGAEVPGEAGEARAGTLGRGDGSGRVAGGAGGGAALQ